MAAHNRLYKKTGSEKGKTKGDKHSAVTLRFTLLSLESLLVNDHLLIHGLSVYLHRNDVHTTWQLCLEAHQVFRLIYIGYPFTRYGVHNSWSIPCCRRHPLNLSRQIVVRGCRSVHQRKAVAIHSRMTHGVSV